MIKKIVKLSAVFSIGGIMLVGFTEEEKDDFSKFSTAGLDLNYVAPNFNEIEDNSPKFITPELGMTYLGFKEALAFKESRGSYDVINQFGYLGKYQFGRGTLKLIGIYNTNEFLNSPELQEKAFYANASRNKWILRRDIKRFDGRVINGVQVTESGILAAAHLAGPGSVKKYLRSGGVQGFSDANGTTIRYYMKRFAGYDTTEVVSDQKAKVKA